MFIDGHKCEICGKHKGDTKWSIDPYQADVNNEEIYRWLCDECYRDLTWEI